MVKNAKNSKIVLRETNLKKEYHKKENLHGEIWC